jgi:hypothetical protein
MVWGRIANDKLIGHLSYQKHERPVLVQSSTLTDSVLESELCNMHDQRDQCRPTRGQDRNTWFLDSSQVVRSMY